MIVHAGQINDDEINAFPIEKLYYNNIPYGKKVKLWVGITEQCVGSSCGKVKMGKHTTHYPVNQFCYMDSTVDGYGK